MNFNWRIGGIRGGNLIAANPRRMQSADGTRWATGRTVKRSLGDGVFDGVEVWALKHRVDGKVVIVTTGVGYDRAAAWVAGH